MTTRTKVHDVIIGVIFLVTLLLAKEYTHHWLYVTGALAALMVISGLVGFCPLYFVLGKMMPDKPAAGA